jgi:hypothetical protein
LYRNTNGENAMHDVKVEWKSRSDRHSTVVQEHNLAGMTAAATAIAQSSGCDIKDVSFVGGYGRITAERNVRLSKNEYNRRMART